MLFSNTLGENQLYQSVKVKAKERLQQSRESKRINKGHFGTVIKNEVTFV